MGICYTSDDPQSGNRRDRDQMSQSHGDQEARQELEGPVISLHMTAPIKRTFQIKGEDTLASLLALVGQEMGSRPEDLQLKLAQPKGAPKFLRDTENELKLFHAGFQDGNQFEATDLMGGGNTQ